MLALAALFALIATLSAIGLIVNRTSHIEHVRVVNDTTQTWTICGSDCTDHRPVLLPGDSTLVETRDAAEVFLEQDGRETGDCLFPSQATNSVVTVSARRSCVR